jgi:hypothetical protein
VFLSKFHETGGESKGIYPLLDALIGCVPVKKAEGRDWVGIYKKNTKSRVALQRIEQHLTNMLIIEAIANGDTER